MTRAAQYPANICMTDPPPRIHSIRPALLAIAPRPRTTVPGGSLPAQEFHGVDQSRIVLHTNQHSAEERVLDVPEGRRYGAGGSKGQNSRTECSRMSRLPT